MTKGYDKIRINYRSGQWVRKGKLKMKDRKRGERRAKARDVI